MKQNVISIVIGLLFIFSLFAEEDNWRLLDDGLDLFQTQAIKKTEMDDSKITVFRIDPSKYELKLFTSDSIDSPRNLTAKQWCEKLNLVAAINAGMYHQDHKTHVGYMKSSGRVLSPTINHYQSAALFNPIHDSLTPFKIIDLDSNQLENEADNYLDIVQNLRLIKHPGENRWSPKGEKWSEALLGEDDSGRILFIFCRSPYTMYDLNEILLSLPIRLSAAQHLEGGPEAQLYIHHGQTKIELFGSYETGFFLNNSNFSAWPIPNIIGISKKKK
jgi:hypothetical protein